MRKSYIKRNEYVAHQSLIGRLILITRVKYYDSEVKITIKEAMNEHEDQLSFTWSQTRLNFIMLTITWAINLQRDWMKEREMCGG